MGTRDNPEMVPRDCGEVFRTFSISGKEGKHMSILHATHETVVIVNEGIAILHIDGKDVILNAGNATVVHSSIPHSLDILKDFKATKLIAVKSAIKFN